MKMSDGGKGSLPRLERNDALYAENFAKIFANPSIEDGHGNSWQKCSRNCWLEVVSPGKVQCEHPKCPK
jgi:hypothetical protein